MVTYIDVLDRIAPELLDQLSKNAEDTNADCRDAALNAMGICKGRLGEAYMAKYLENMNA